MKPLSRLEPLTDAQRAQIAAWLQEYDSYETIIARAREQFGVEIPRMTLSRYRARLAFAEHLDDSPECAAAAAEFVQYAATAQDNFSRATLHILEQKAFELALTCRVIDEDMEALKTVSAILCRHRTANVRERLATVQEKKCELRRQELELQAARHGIPLTALERPQPAENPPTGASSNLCPFPDQTATPALESA